MIFGLALSLACALATNVAFLLKHRGAVLAPPVRVRHPLQSAAGLFRSTWFTLGWVVAVGAWGLHVAALALAPLSIVQAVLSGGWSSSPSRRTLFRFPPRAPAMDRPARHRGRACRHRGDLGIEGR